MFKHKYYRMWLIILLAGLVTLIPARSGRAAEVAGGEVYRLAAGETVNDDLYVSAGEIYIDGTIQGDLVAAGGYIEINGTVTGDLIAAGGGIVLAGQVEEDARLAGGGIDVTGRVGDDLFAAAGGGSGFFFPTQFGGQNVEPGLRLADSVQVGGDAYVAGGAGNLAGSLSGDLWAGMGELTLATQVAGDAHLESDNIQLDPGAAIAGTLSYTAEAPVASADQVANNVEYSAPEPEAAANPIWDMLGWLARTAGILLGFALLAWLLLRFAPRLLTRPANAIANRPARAGLYGLLAAVGFIFIPLISALLVFLMVLLWGWFPGLVLAFFLFGALALLWFLSPLVTGLWLGQRLNLALGREVDYLPLLVTGVLLLALLGRIPILGWLVYLVSFILALGGLIVARWPGGGTPSVIPVESPRPAPYSTGEPSRV